MPKWVWKTLKLCLAGLVNVLLLENTTLAEETPAINQNIDSLKRINQYSQKTTASYSVANLQSSDSMTQVTSVSQLSDVQPTDWAFQALQSLVERYGCIAGYPDSTYRGNRALTRYEFAAGVNACLDRVNELIATATAAGVTREDLTTIERLQAEFAAELATLRGRVDAVEANVAQLEANQFSTTTKLVGKTSLILAMPLVRMLTMLTALILVIDYALTLILASQEKIVKNSFTSY